VGGEVSGGVEGALLPEDGVDGVDGPGAVVDAAVELPGRLAGRLDGLCGGRERARSSDADEPGPAVGEVVPAGLDDRVAAG
jgi:hypothetical protein